MHETRRAFPEQWQSGLDALRTVRSGGVCLIVGTAGQGKTTFAVGTGNLLSSASAKVAFIDANIAHSEIGFPATVAVAWVEPHVQRVQDLAVEAQFFVGAASVRHVTLELICAVSRAVQWARGAGATLTIIDLASITSSASSRRLVATLTQTISPDLVLAFCKPAELDDIRDITSAFADAAVMLQLETTDEVVQKSEAQRLLLAQARTYGVFKEAREMRFSLETKGATDSVYTLNSTLGTGEAQQPHLVRWISQTLRHNVVRAEITDARQLNIYVRGRVEEREEANVATGIVTQHFGVRSTRLIPLGQLVDTYVGLIDTAGRLVGVGRFAGLAESTGEMIISTAVSTSHRVRVIQFGKMRVAADGSYRGEF